jgi:glutathione S-transferase
MLKLYYAPLACSISPHIALREAGLPFELVRVDFKAGKKLPDGSDFSKVNPKGYVPALMLDDGEVLTEGVSIIQYIAGLKPESGLAPPPTSFGRVRLQEWLNFIATELHKGLGPLFSNLASDEFKEAATEKLASRLAFLARGIGDKPYLFSDRFTVADGYAFYVLRTWNRVVKREPPGGLAAYHDRIAARPAVQAALQTEGTP